MNLADVFSILFIILGFLIVYVAYWLATAGLFPLLTQRCADALGRSPVKLTFLGLVTWLPLLGLGSMISNKAPDGPIKLIGVLLLIAAVLLALAGSAGLALRVGEGLKSARDESEPWRRTLRGGIVLALTFVLPFVGTAVMVVAFVAGFGAIVATMFRRRPQPLSPTVADVAQPVEPLSQPATTAS